MCGIVGIFHTRDFRDINPLVLTRMNDSQAHRGPDDSGIYLVPGIGIGHRRLSIIDLGGGHQPMFNEDGSVAVVFNGEIYNFRDLLRLLEGRGHHFHTKCDTEVIVHAWEEWGEACLEHFQGMFAFAVWDQRQQTLFLGRDRLGIKPLHYAVLGDETIIFSSELKGLLAHPELPRTIDPHAVEEYLAYGYVPDPKTIFHNVFKLAPAHCLVVRRDTPVSCPRPYWDIAFRKKHEVGETRTKRELLDRLGEAVGSHLISDVPLGAFLSGGVDSSAVVALMSQVSNDPVETCSISVDVPMFDESHYAALVAEQFGTRHHVRRIDSSALTPVNELARIFDEPFADSSAIPTYQVCALAREHVTVALSGDGGDEIFAGYRRYRWHGYEEKVRQSISAPVRKILFGLLGAVYPKLDWAPRYLRGQSTLRALAKDSAGGFFDSVCIIADSLRRELYTADMKRELNGYHASEVIRQHIQRAPADQVLDRIQYADMKTYLPGDILTKVDRTSMANSLEVRVPLLDHVFVEWAAGLRDSEKLADGEGKYIFKKALEGLLPNEILYRPKAGFSIPIAAWFRGPLRDSIQAAFDSGPLAGSGIFNQRTLQVLLRKHTTGMRDHGSTLWSLLMLDAFLENIGSNAQ